MAQSTPHILAPRRLPMAGVLAMALLGVPAAATEVPEPPVPAPAPAPVPDPDFYDAKSLHRIALEFIAVYRLHRETIREVNDFESQLKAAGATEPRSLRIFRAAEARFYDAAKALVETMRTGRRSNVEPARDNFQCAGTPLAVQGGVFLREGGEELQKAASRGE